MAKKVSHNPAAADLRTPKYRARIVRNRKRELPRKAKHKGVAA